MEPKSRPKSKDEDFQDDCLTSQKNARSHNRIESKSLHINLAGHVFESTSSPAQFGSDQCLESTPAIPSSSSSTASSQPADFWDTPEQKSPKFSSSAELLTPPTPSISPFPLTGGKQVFESPSPTPRNRSGLLSTKEAQCPVRARNLVSTTTDLTSVIGCLGHYDASAKEITEAETISNKPALGNSNSSPIRKLVQRRLFPQEQPEMPAQESSECLDVEDSIDPPLVTSTLKKNGLSNLQTQNSAGQRQRACSKSSECLDAEANFKLSSTYPKVKRKVSGDSLPQDTPTVQKQEVHTKDAEIFIPQDGTESSLFVLKTERSNCDNSLQHCSTASNKLLEGPNREFRSQGPKSQAQERDSTLKKPSKPRKIIEARGQEPENTDYGIVISSGESVQNR